MSLKQSLVNKIKQQGYMSYEEVERYCKAWGYRPENGYRRLRPSDSPEIETVMKEPDLFNKKIYILGYKWKGKT